MPLLSAEEIDQAIEELVFLPRTDKNHPQAALDKAAEEYLPAKLAAIEKKKAEDAKQKEKKEEAEGAKKAQVKEKVVEEEWVLEAEGMDVPKVRSISGGLK